MFPLGFHRYISGSKNKGTIKLGNKGTAKEFSVKQLREIILYL